MQGDAPLPSIRYIDIPCKRVIGEFHGQDMLCTGAHRFEWLGSPDFKWESVYHYRCSTCQQEQGATGQEIIAAIWRLALSFRDLYPTPPDPFVTVEIGCPRVGCTGRLLIPVHDGAEIADAIAIWESRPDKVIRWKCGVCKGEMTTSYLQVGFEIRLMALKRQQAALEKQHGG